MPPHDAEHLYELLCKLTLGAQIEGVILRARLPRDKIAAPTASIQQRALDIVELARQGGPKLAARIGEAIGKEAPFLSPPPAEPVYENAEIRALAQQLEAERGRQAALREAGASTAEVEARILDLRRKLREGGRLRAGDALGEGRYLLLDLLGRGGFASVWRARDRMAKSEVAIKALHPEQAGDPTRLERFFRGARVMGTLTHAAVVRVLDPQGECGGHHYFVMELLAGGDLHRAVVKGRVRAEEALAIVLRVGEALAEAHEKGIVHRDVKPANVLLDEVGAPKLTDFDLVALGETTGGTRTGAAMGSWLFMAPEQGHDAKGVDLRADVYGLGMTALFCLHGRELPAFVSRKPERVIAALAVAEGVKAALTRAIEIEPGDRFGSVRELCEALRAVVDKGASPPPPPNPVRRAVVASPPQPAVGTSNNGPRGGEAWRDPTTGMSFVWVPPGRFLMGASKEVGALGFDPEAFDDEGPAHEVELPHGVWMGEHPVTNAEYGAFLAEVKKTAHPEFWRDARFKAPAQPVVGVSFEDAIAFCAWLTKRAGLPVGKVFDLPTEAEWEHAARGIGRA